MFRETFPELSDVSIFFPTRVLSIFNRAEISKNDIESICYDVTDP